MKLKHIFLFVILPIAVIAIGIEAYGSNEAKIRTDYSNQHATVTHPITRVCGDHPCQPGEDYNATNGLANATNATNGLANATNATNGLANATNATKP
jgi:hypothetical protein